MKKLALVPMVSNNKLPKWDEPKNLTDATATISNLGRDMHEHAYLVGRTLLWVKKEVGHGKFYSWLENNVWFGPDTAQRMMNFARRCDRQTQIVDYHPSKNRTMRHLSSQNSKEEKTKELDWDGQERFHLIDWLRKELKRWPDDRRNEAAYFIRQILKEFNL